MNEEGQPQNDIIEVTATITGRRPDSCLDLQINFSTKHTDRLLWGKLCANCQVCWRYLFEESTYEERRAKREELPCDQWKTESKT